MILKNLHRLITEFRSREEQIKNGIEILKIQNENLRKQNEMLINKNAELEWANIYHDSIKDKKWLCDLSLSPGRWAANYSLLYLIVRILADCQPEKILEFGLGESSKLVSLFLNYQLRNSKHLILEQDENWGERFTSKFNLSTNSEIVYLPLVNKNINGFLVNCYDGIETTIKTAFDFYLIDGPFGSRNFSRFDIILLSENLQTTNEFIIVIDDYNRKGEKDTVLELVSKLRLKGFKIFTGEYFGEKAQIVIATEKYRLITTL